MNTKEAFEIIMNLANEATKKGLFDTTNEVVKVHNALVKLNNAISVDPIPMGDEK